MSGFFESKFNLVNTLFKNVSSYIIQKLNKRDVLENPWTAVFVPNQYKTGMMWERAVDAYPWVLKFVSMGIIPQKMCGRAVGKKLMGIGICS